MLELATTQEHVKLRRVAWLTDLLDFPSDKQTYDAINKGHIPADCVLRIGRSLRVIPNKVAAWLGSGGEKEGERRHETTK